MNIVVRNILTIIFIPLFISFFLKMVAAPAEYLVKRLDEQMDSVQHRSYFED